MVRTWRWMLSGRVTVGLSVIALLAAGVVFGGCAGSTAVGGPCGAPCAEEPVCDPCAPGDLPKEAQAGEAWCRVWIPPQYGQVMETVCVKPACKRQVRVPAKWATRPKLVCVHEAEMCEKVVGAVWGVTKRERVVCPEQECYKRIDCPDTNLNPCEVQCECWTKTTRPAVTCEEECPVCISPERRCIQYQPAQYRVEPERYLLQPARCVEVCDPPQFEQRFCETCIKPGHWEWRRNETCEVPVVPCKPMPVPLPALQVQMQDSAESGAEAGTFAVGDTVRYDLVISGDQGSKSLQGVKVVFKLPAELEFTGGSGNGVTVTGSGQQAESGSFDLGAGQTVKMHILCRVTASPPSNLVQLTASITDGTGQELAEETESTTLKPN